MDKSWEELKFWGSGEWQVVCEKLDDLDKAGIAYNPGRKRLFFALEHVPVKDVKVIFLGQDPYPNPSHCTGLAFSVPSQVRKFPPSLETLIREYMTDLHHPRPKSGSLIKWAKEGVVLWNVVPTCLAYKSMSHQWTEWEYLTKEILEVLSKTESVVVVALGHVAQGYLKYVKADSPVIRVAHPSPRGSARAKYPFVGSRLFTTINTKLAEQGISPVDWRL